jgi:hypothetical protein
MKRTWTISIVFCATASISAAANQTSWVASTGTDNSACGAPHSPCATFQQAHDNTVAGGTVKAADRADYGALSINKAITIDGAGVAEIMVKTNSSNTAAISIAAGNSDQVTIRDLAINGNRTAVGICIFRATQVHLQNVVITGSGIVTFPGSAGILTADHLTVVGADSAVSLQGFSARFGDSAIRGNAAGVFVTPLPGFPSISERVMVENCEIRFRGTGLLVVSSLGPETANISDSAITGNSFRTCDSIFHTTFPDYFNASLISMSRFRTIDAGTEALTQEGM